MNKQKRTCLPISWACNSKCIFCMDNWNLAKFVTIDEIIQKLKSAKEYSDEVTFSSLEPTLHPKLNEIVEIARDMWFSRIEIVTNGRKLANFEYTESLVKSWINEFDISIHSYDSEKHDFIVQAKWAFLEWLSWLINVCKLSNKYDIKKTVSITICKQNYTDVYKIVYFLERFWLDNIILNILQLKNSANDNKELTHVSYSLMIQEFLKLKKYQNKYNNIYINWLVPCLHEQLKDMIWYFNWAQINNKDEKWEYLVEFNNFKEKRKECSSCKYNNICDWVWSSYIDKFWWDEFLPVK